MKESITIHTYFCPKCGKRMESKDATISKGCIYSKISCPSCGVSLNISGTVFICAGLFTLIFAGMASSFIPVLIGILIVGVGIARITRQAIAEKSRKKINHTDSPADKSP